MGIFDGLRNASVFERGSFLNPGMYDLDIERCLVKQTRKSGDAFIVEFKVVASTGEGANAPGSKASWFQKLTDRNIAFGAMKEFVYAALGYDYAKDKEKIEKEVDPNIEAIMADAVDKDKNGLKGMRVKCQVNMKKTLRGLDFSQHIWTPAT